MMKRILFLVVLSVAWVGVGCSGGGDTSGDIPTKAGSQNNTEAAKQAAGAPPQTDAPPPGGPRKGAGGGMAVDPSTPRPQAGGAAAGSE